MDFAPIILEDRTVVFELRFNEETLAKYPFQFSFKIKYTLENNQLIITYIIENLFEDEMYYSVGGHPAFVLPYPNLSEYYIEFDKSVSSIVRHLLNNGLISGHTETLPLDSRKLRLTKEMFDKDAIVLKNDINTSLALKHINSNFKIGLVYEQFTDLGIWTKQGTEQFICLEPWVGYADREGYEGELKDKKGIKKISPNAIDEYTYKLSFNI
jgi:galactose mutarotase-like enzyme